MRRQGLTWANSWETNCNEKDGRAAERQKHTEMRRRRGMTTGYCNKEVEVHLGEQLGDKKNIPQQKCTMGSRKW